MSNDDDLTMRVRRILAPNPGVYTGPGTNTYVVGDESGVVVIDPGPVIPVHADAIMTAIGDTPVTSVIVTHTHPDHAPLANPLAADLGVVALGHASGPGFVPDAMLSDGDSVRVGTRSMVVLHTPGHADDHLCFLLGTTLFTGDHIMGGSSVMVDDLRPYLASLRRLQDLEIDHIHPGHGPDIGEPQAVISWYLAHRLERERQIVRVLDQGPSTIDAIVETIYADVDSALFPAAARSVAAHLRKLAEDGLVAVEGDTWSVRVAKTDLDEQPPRDISGDSSIGAG